MKPIIFTKHPAEIHIDGHGICVYHKKYADCLPNAPGLYFIEFGRLCNTYKTNDYFRDIEVAAFVGANNFFNSSTRIHPIYEILQYSLHADRYYSIDISPYIGPIWRLWIHWSLTRLPFNGYTYSYLLESHYNAYLEGIRENPMSLENIFENARGNVDIQYKQYFSQAKIHIETFFPLIYEKYFELKKRLFDEHDRISPIIKGLTDYAKSIYPGRTIPQEHKLFEIPERIIINRTDLKVDEYLTKKLVEKITEVNKVCKVLNDSLSQL